MHSRIKGGILNAQNRVQVFKVKSSEPFGLVIDQ